jgi:hypothetical protein
MDPELVVSASKQLEEALKVLKAANEQSTGESREGTRQNKCQQRSRLTSVSRCA